MRESTESPVPADEGAALIDGRYRVKSSLGGGAMGAVFRVLDTTTQRHLALKRLRDPDEDTHTRRQRAEIWFRREFHTVARLRHPSIVEAYDFGLDQGRPYYTMELLDGQDLRDLPGVELRTACALLRDVASALAFLHARRLLHRDLKARNVRCTSDGRAKLMDFGVLATMGVVGDVAGTPPGIPPEALRGLPLDGRADLFGLGALAYWLLAGRHAYPAREVADLERVWLEHPAAVSQHRADVPAALDELVMALLSLDRQGRPSDAAEVVDRLDAIGGLERRGESDDVQGWLRSAAIVGRERELAYIRSVATATIQGTGRGLLFEAPSGMGKTRLLREAGFEGQLAGATVLRARGTASGVPFEVVHQLVRAALVACPRDVARTIRPHAPVIGRIVPEVLRLARAELAAPRGDASEDRLRLQSELSSWFSALARARPTILLIDELQRCDEASAALLAALGHGLSRQRLSIVAAQRTDEPISAPLAVDALRDDMEVLPVEGLAEPDVSQLVRELFGDVDHADRLAGWIHKVAGGSPMHCTELARHLVERGTIVYAEGMWIIPPELGDEALPSGLAAAMDARIETLEPDARAVAELMAVLGKRVPLEMCVEMSDTMDEPRVFAALDQLMFDDVVLADARGFELRHDGLREALLRGLTPEDKSRLHQRAARVLEQTQDFDPSSEAAIGWHWLAAGEAMRGARMLERAGRRLYDAYSFADAIAPLEAALEVYERTGHDRRRCLDLRQMLMRAGVICDRTVVLRYADDTIAALHRDSGLHLASTLRPWLGRYLAFGVALIVANVVWLLAGGSKRRASPIETMTLLVALINYVASVRSLTFATERLIELARLLEPLAVMRRRIPGAAHRLVKNFLWIAEGRLDHVRRNCEKMIEIIEGDDKTPLPEIDRKLALGAVHFMRASADALDQDPAYAESVEAMEALDLRFFAMGGRMDRVLFHRLRGEETTAVQLKEETELLFVQLGNAWVFESQHAWISSIAYGMTRDVLGLKRALEELERLIAAGYRLEGFARLARGEYLRERGDAAGSRIALQRALEELPAGNFMLAQLTHAALAESLLAEGDHEHAALLAERGLALGDETERGMRTARLRLACTRALAAAAAGRTDQAQRELESLLQQARELDSPVILATIHEALARVADATGDCADARAHRHNAERLLSSTKNPVLIARGRRLCERDATPTERAERDEEPDADTIQAADAETAIYSLEAGESATHISQATITEDDQTRREDT